jgi:hypothetical protein
MGDIVNLRSARKRAKRRAQDVRATANRLAHGRSKAERALAAARRAKGQRDLDAQRIPGDDE